MSLSNISPTQSAFLTQFQCPISLHFFADYSSWNAFSDGGKAFVESLLQRDSPFGDLCLEASHTDTFHRLLQVKAINALEVKCQELSRDIPPIFSASAKRIKFSFNEMQMLAMDWSKFDIAPKELALSFPCHEETHFSVVSSFLRRIAELRDIVKLELELYFAFRVPESLIEALIQAVDANQSLVELILRKNLFSYNEHWKEMLETMERHKNFRRFIVPSYPKHFDPDYSMLKRLLKRHQLIDFLGNSRPTDDDEVNQLYAFADFFQIVKKISSRSQCLGYRIS
jgi:hypothetical protein